MAALTSTRLKQAPEARFAIVLEGITERWDMNVLQITGRATAVEVEMAGYGTAGAPAILLNQQQARHLAAQIIELLGPER